MSDKKDKATRPISSLQNKKSTSASMMRLPISRTPSSCYSCEFPKCGRNFARKDALKRHKRIVHDQHKGFKCERCNYTCSFSYNLKRHMLRHTGEKPYSCGACQKKFADNKNLRGHFSKMHPGIELVLKRHNKVHRSERPEDIEDDIKPLCSPSPATARDIQDKEAKQQEGLVTEQRSQSSFSSSSLPGEEDMSSFIPMTAFSPVTPLSPMPGTPLNLIPGTPLSPFEPEDMQVEVGSLFQLGAESDLPRIEAGQQGGLVTEQRSQSSASASSFSRKRKSPPSPNTGNSTSSNSFFSSAPSSFMSSSSVASSSLDLITEVPTQHSIVPQSLPASSPTSTRLISFSSIPIAESTTMQDSEQPLSPMHANGVEENALLVIKKIVYEQFEKAQLTCSPLLPKIMTATNLHDLNLYITSSYYSIFLTTSNFPSKDVLICFLKTYLNNLHGSRDEKKERLREIIMSISPDTTTQDPNWATPNVVPLESTLSTSSYAQLHKNFSAVHAPHQSTPSQSKTTCHICKKEYKLDFQLKRHLKTHTEGRPYACNQCDWRFRRESVLKRHLQTHTGEKPFGCEASMCGKRFGDKVTLHKHQAKVHHML